MDVFEAIHTRRSIKKFSDQAVEFDKIMSMCEAGNKAPSSGNIQNWTFVVIRDKDKIRGPFHNACIDQDCVQTAQYLIVVCADEDMVERQYGLRGKRLYSVQNCAAAIQNMLLAAQAMGLGANWIGAFNEERVNSLIDVPLNVARPQAIIAVGYPGETPQGKRQRHLDDVTRFEKYGSRYRDVHLTTKDFSVEWAKQAKTAKEAVDKQTNKFMERAKEAYDRIKEKFDSELDNKKKNKEQKKLTDLKK